MVAIRFSLSKEVCFLCHIDFVEDRQTWVNGGDGVQASSTAYIEVGGVVSDEKRRVAEMIISVDHCVVGG